MWGLVTQNLSIPKNSRIIVIHFTILSLRPHLLWNSWTFLIIKSCDKKLYEGHGRAENSFGGFNAYLIAYYFNLEGIFLMLKNITNEIYIFP